MEKTFMRFFCISEPRAKNSNPFFAYIYYQYFNVTEVVSKVKIFYHKGHKEFSQGTQIYDY